MYKTKTILVCPGHGAEDRLGRPTPTATSELGLAGCVVQSRPQNRKSVEVFIGRPGWFLPSSHVPFVKDKGIYFVLAGVRVLQISTCAKDGE